MATMTVWVKLEESPSSGYSHIDKVFRSGEELKEDWKSTKKQLEKYDVKAPSFEDYKEDFTKVTVKYDGRKKGITKNQIMKALENRGTVKKVSEGGAIGGYYEKVGE